MKRLLVILITTLGFGQINPVRILGKACLSADMALDPIFAKEDLISIPNQRVEFSNGVNWENEIVDSCDYGSHSYKFNIIALDTNNIPYIIYNKYAEVFKIIFASRTDSGWQKEVVESGLFYYGFSLIFDDNNTAHLSYYRKDDALNTTYICHALRDSFGWQIEAVDSSYGYLGNWFWDFNSSIDLDTSGLPGIAYIAWNIEDSLHYIKYAHYNGTNWDTSIVEYDSAYANMQTAPTDWSPSLKFDHKNTPHIAFYHVYALYNSDTLKLAYYDDTLSIWIVSSILCDIHAGIPVSLTLNSLDYPCIAHGYGAGLTYTWWNGVSWNTDYDIAGIGWVGIRIKLDLDSFDRPHIAYLPDMPSCVYYCYKDSVWHLCVPPDTLVITHHADICLTLDDDGQPHISYWFKKYYGNTNGVKYAKGTFVGINEDARYRIQDTRFRLEVYPNPAQEIVNIEYALSVPGKIALSIYDISGSRVKLITRDNLLPGYYQEKIDVSKLSNGVYFIVLRQGDEKTSKKLVLVR